MGPEKNFESVFEVDTITGHRNTIYTSAKKYPHINTPLAFKDGTLYGVAGLDGANAMGSVFQIDSAGVQTTLCSFSGGADGKIPNGGLTRYGSGFVGSTFEGGASGSGTAFEVIP